MSMISPGNQLALPEQCRCECGNLLAKMAPEGIEVKCRRCKRIVLLRFADIQGWEPLNKGGAIERTLQA